MGYKHTFEIITKDIQDIEKLVGNFENYSEIPYIELDLALSKLRNVYEILLMFRESGSTPLSASNLTVQGKEPQHVPDTIKKPEESLPPENKDATVNYQPPVDAPQPVQPVIPQNPDPTQKTEQSVEQIPHTTHQTEQERKILAEKFNENKAFINEMIGNNVRKGDLSSRLQSAPITSIAGSIGINDKFLFIRELFHGDAEKFRATMQNLEHASDFDEAYHYLNDNFEWNMESVEVKQLIHLVKRKFLHG